MGACREFPGARTTSGDDYYKGYGMRRRNGKNVLVHRWVVAQILGWEAIKGKVVRHTCDNPPCFLYEHLLVGTHADNAADRETRGRGVRTGSGRPRREVCHLGHPIVERHGHRFCETCVELWHVQKRARDRAAREQARKDCQ